MNPTILDTVEYTVEVWDINNVFVADISHLISTSLRINRQLNDVDEISFSIDLVQFEKMCASIGARPINIIEPYRTDIKIRRNDKYLVGGHVIRTHVNFNAQETNKLEVQCTGYLNHFKDRLISGSYLDQTYAQIARNLITDTQAAYNHVKDPQFLFGIKGWKMSFAAFFHWDQTIGHNYPGSIFCNTSERGTPMLAGGLYYEVPMKQGIEYTVKFWYRAMTTGGSIHVAISGVAPRYNETVITSTDWTYFETTFVAEKDGSGLLFRTTESTDFWLDEISITNSIDAPIRRSFGVTLGEDFASPNQQADRVRTYDLQNVKDAIINLTKLENDNFEFEFDANKVFRTYTRLGSDKPHIELVYPQNITSMQIARDAQTLHNKIFGIGSGIGDERLQVDLLDADSGLTYRVRETTELYNSVENINTLSANTYGVLAEKKDMYDSIAINIANNTLDLNEVGLGDAIYLRVDDSSYVDYINGMFRIVELSLDVSTENVESITLKVVKWY